MLRELVAMGNTKMLSEERRNKVFGETHFLCYECVSRMRFVASFRVKGITHFSALSGFDESRFPESSRDYVLGTKVVQRLALLNAKLRALRFSVLRLTDAQFACTVINCRMQIHWYLSQVL